jgi:hypothetical protein
MSTLNDTLALGLVLVLLFGAASLYLYTRVQQCEQKLNLVESILLDIKMSAELREYPDIGIGGLIGGSGGGSSSSNSSSGGISGSGSGSSNQEQALYTSALEEAHMDGIQAAPLKEFEEDAEGEAEEVKEVSLVKQTRSLSALGEVSKTSSSLSVNYEAMTLVELKELARQRSIKGFSTMRRSQILEALRAHETGVQEPVKLNEGILTALLEQAQTLDQTE